MPNTKDKIIEPEIWMDWIWTDELVFEFTNFYEEYVKSHSVVWTSVAVEEFKKSKQPKLVLFITEDNVAIYEGDVYFAMDNKFNYWYSGGAGADSGKDKTCKYFSTKEAANEYVIYNKPCLSINDFISLWDSPNIRKSRLIQDVEKLAKQKINGI